MEVSEIINILKQAAELAQAGGALTIEEASVVTTAMDNLNNEENIKLALTVLLKVAEIAQKKGVYTLKDAYFIYLACDAVSQLPDDTPSN